MACDLAWCVDAHVYLALCSFPSCSPASSLPVRFARSDRQPAGDWQMDEDDARKDEDRAFILRLPPDRAREVRQMLADNNFRDIRLHVDPAADRHVV